MPVKLNSKAQVVPLTAKDIEAIEYLIQHPGSSTSDVGAHLWSSKYKKPQSFARPAGRLLHALAHNSYVWAQRNHETGGTNWHPTNKAGHAFGKETKP